ncbi:hypothetical protein B0T24DRAFT_358697 [Lasiosphaeria ovina]|uniref:Zinc finger PHD-type domain-containing protein n=1 Tax=Lasiosphaeria ovina TaxID=92902 RepID=A0AAE0K4H0_9PEZI|nr:hypothetical protein B0T24DRAFT_358697 [Lasiosphaeria ovina]
MQALGREGRLDVAVAIQQWQTHAQATHHDRSVTARLCDGILGLFQEVIRQVALQQPTSKIPKRVRRSLERAHGIVALWSDGYGVKDGHLDDVLAKSRKIRQATLKILSSITDALVKRLIPLARLSSEKLDAFVLQVEATTDEASYVIHDADASDSDVSSDALSDLELEDSIAEVAEDLKTDAQCLMDLDPLFRNPVLDVSTQKEDKALQILEWAPEKAYVDKIQQRFPQADGSLVEMLGRANWSRYLRCQEQRNGTGEEEEEEDEAEVIYNRAPAAVRASVELHGTIVSSKYHDSGLGTSLPTASVYAETVMTYSGPGEGQKIRIPPLPDEARRGKPFACVACGKTVHISNNRKWKQHLYVDLRPDLCLEDGCLGFSFAHRADWISHLALDHQYEPDWVAITCPLCLERTEPGRLAVTSHLARHLEEISLSALPPSPDDDEVSVSSRASSESTHEGIVADAYGRRHKCVCGGASPFLEEYSTSVACGTCNTWQHVGCYYKYSDWTAVEKPGFSHHCEECEPRQLEVEFTRRAASLSSQGNKVRCVCGLQEPPHSPREIVMEDYSEQNMVCSRCFVWQHGYCIALTDEVETRMRGKPYFCDACAPFLHTTYDIESG